MLGNHYNREYDPVGDKIRDDISANGNKLYIRFKQGSSFLNDVNLLKTKYIPSSPPIEGNIVDYFIEEAAVHGMGKTGDDLEQASFRFSVSAQIKNGLAYNTLLPLAMYHGIAAELSETGVIKAIEGIVNNSPTLKKDFEIASAVFRTAFRYGRDNLKPRIKIQ